MRVKTEVIFERELMFAISGQLYSQAPNRQPRKVEIIMNEVRNKYREKAFNDNGYYSLRVENLYKYIKELLMSIPEFVELNLTQNEYEKGIKVDDKNRGKYRVTSMYDKNTSESWKNDFIDLDAFIKNVYRNIYVMKDADTDCFCCIYDDGKFNSDKCKECFINPNHTINYECSRKPRDKYTITCKYDCYKSKYICCEECDYKVGCEQKCNSSSINCGLSIKKK